jgi:predicted RecB family nuclease
MQLLEGEIILSATDLTGFLECEHLTQLELKAAKGELVRPVRDDPELDILTRRGGEHEAAHLARLRGEGRSVVEISTASRTRADLHAREAETLAAMRAGAEVIYQATFFDGRWRGHADFLLRVERSSDLGPWSYEVADTKLARKVKTAALLQMSNYSEQLFRIQGTHPLEMHVVLGTGLTAYYRAAKARYEAAVIGPERETYPDPVDHCGVCRWRDVCSDRRRADDHLSLVAGMRRDVTRNLVDRGITTVADLVAMEPTAEVDRVGRAVLDRLRQQARMQLEQRQSGKVHYEVLPPRPGLGLSLLPAPSPGDLFFDMEGDPFAGAHGLEYLFGVVELVDDEPRFHSWWGHNPAVEKQAFEGFIDFAIARLDACPDLHIYHYAPYEPTRLKSLMGRYGTREDEVDRLLRGEVLVDLYQVVRQSVMVSQDSYSIKKLEPLYMGKRQADIADAGSSIVASENWLESRDPALLESIERYNEEDCVSTWLLRNWLEDRRAEVLERFGVPAEAPVPVTAAGPSAAQAAIRAETAALAGALTADVPLEPAQRSPDQHALWLLAQLLDWHRREARSQWWDYFRRHKLTDEELVADSEAIGLLRYEGEVGLVRRSVVHRYRFDPTQLHKISVGQSPHDPRTLKAAGTVEAIDNLIGTVDLARATGSAVPHPTSLVPEGPRATNEQRMAIARVARRALDSGLDDIGPFRHLGDLLRRQAPRVRGAERDETLMRAGEASLSAARRIAMELDSSYLPVQGPPGSGKTWIGARMIVELVQAGKRVGIAATSHKAICNLLDGVCQYADASGVNVRAMQRSPEDQRCSSEIVRWVKDNGAVEAALAAGEVDVLAGTAWMFAREPFEGALDVMFIDEAGQMSLADMLAVGQAARTLVLLGDPQQLAYPSQGIHPDGAGLSALEYILDGRQTIPSDAGLFLDRTFRMHPDVCGFISEVAYEGRLAADPTCAEQGLGDGSPIGGTGIRQIPVEHHGNRTVSPEEIVAVAELVKGLIGREWTDVRGDTRPLRAEDILVVAPYNAQVDRLQLALPAGCAAGTVDRFQGQEAPVVIYSLASSSPEDMPRQMEFLYSLNRLNVAISRARGLAILVCSPAVLRVRARSAEQMRLANAFARLAEVATPRPVPFMPESSTDEDRLVVADRGEG